MKLKTTLKLLFFFSSFLLSITSKAQTNNETKLLGTWAFTGYTFIRDEPDSLNYINESKGLIVSFEKGNKFITKQKINDTEKTVGTGTYTISKDGKYLYQNDEEVEIIILNEKEFVMKVPNAVIIHLKRLK
jgi:hypothetical protein